MSVFGRLLGRHRSDWAESWQAYPGTAATAPAAWAVDLGAVAVAPLPHLPVRLDIEVAVDAGPDGLPVDGAQVASLEDAVRAVLVDLGGAYIGRIATGGTWRVTAHLPPEPPTPIELATPTPVPASGGPTHQPPWAHARQTQGPGGRQPHLRG